LYRAVRGVAELWDDFPRLFVESPVDLGDLCDPALTLAVFERENLVVRPVKVIGNVRYLLIEPL
jgi:hypothetical protein